MFVSINMNSDHIHFCSKRLSTAKMLLSLVRFQMQLFYFTFRNINKLLCMQTITSVCSTLQLWLQRHAKKLETHLHNYANEKSGRIAMPLTITKLPLGGAGMSECELSFIIATNQLIIIFFTFPCCSTSSDLVHYLPAHVTIGFENGSSGAGRCCTDTDTDR